MPSMDTRRKCFYCRRFGEAPGAPGRSGPLLPRMLGQDIALRLMESNWYWRRDAQRRKETATPPERKFLERLNTRTILHHQSPSARETLMAQTGRADRAREHHQFDLRNSGGGSFTVGAEAKMKPPSGTQRQRFILRRTQRSARPRSRGHSVLCATSSGDPGGGHRDAGAAGRDSSRLRGRVTRWSPRASAEMANATKAAYRFDAKLLPSTCWSSTAS